MHTIEYNRRIINCSKIICQHCMQQSASGLCDFVNTNFGIAYITPALKWIKRFSYATHLLILTGKLVVPINLVDYLRHTDYLPFIVDDRQTEDTVGCIASAFVNFLVESWIL